MTASESDPDFILAYVRVLRLTDRLLSAADELRTAREFLDAAIEARARDGGTGVRTTVDRP